MLTSSPKNDNHAKPPVPTVYPNTEVKQINYLKAKKCK